MGVAGACWLAWLQAAGQGQSGQSMDWATLLGVASFTLPAVVLVVPATLWALRRGWAVGAMGASRVVMAGVVCAPVAAVSMSAGNQLSLVLSDRLPPGLPIISMVGDSLTLLVVLLPVAWLVLGLRYLHSRLATGTGHRGRAALALGLGIATAMSTAALAPSTAMGVSTAATAAGSVCPTGAPARSYDVQSINVNIPLNRFGDHDPKGRMYVLTSAADCGSRRGGHPEGVHRPA